MYQVYPRSFQDSNGDGIGDIPGILSRLDHLSALGINALWLSPVFRSPNDDNGYDISGYREIMDEFGTMEDWDALCAECHKRGIKVIMDLVVNHSSDEHPWFLESKTSRDNPKSDYYIWRDPKNGKEPNNWASVFGGSAWEFVPERGQYYYHLFSKKQPDLNWANPALREEIFSMMEWWVKKAWMALEWTPSATLISRRIFRIPQSRHSRTAIRSVRVSSTVAPARTPISAT